MIQATTQQIPRSSSTTPLPDATKNLACDMYVKGGKSQTSIATELGIHPKTLSYWIKQNKWQEIKNEITMSSIFIRHNLYTQLGALSEHIVSREEGNCFPSSEEVTMQCKLVQAIFKFPDYSYDDIHQLYKELGSNDKIPISKQTLTANKDLSKQAENQALAPKSTDKDRIKMDKEEIKNEVTNTAETVPLDPAYIPKKNVVLRSGVRWIEKGLAYDPSIRQNRKLRKSEYDELMRKGLTKADFQDWHPGY